MPARLFLEPGNASKFSIYLTVKCNIAVGSKPGPLLMEGALCWHAFFSELLQLVFLLEHTHYQPPVARRVTSHLHASLT